MKLLALCDSPHLESGFGRVARQLLSRWTDHFRDGIDVWGVGSIGWPHSLPFRIFPAGTELQPWMSAERMHLFLRQLSGGGYTHLWILQDTFQFTLFPQLPGLIQQVCAAKGIKSYFYFPVDAPLEASWCEILKAVDFPVAYTEYGVIAAAAHGVSVRALPHGVDTGVFRPVPELRTANRRIEIGKDREFAVGADELFLLTVSTNQRRKDMARLMQVLHRLRHSSVPAKLLFHCTLNSADGVNLDAVGRHYELTRGVEWDCTDELFVNGHGTITDEELNTLYNLADAVVTATLGEGWGLTVTEALAAGCPVFAPHHTSLVDFNNQGFSPQLALVETEPAGLVLPYDNSRVRHPVSVGDLSHHLTIFHQQPRSEREAARVGLTPQVERFLSWPLIAEEWRRLFRQPKPQPRPLATVNPTSKE